MIDFEAEELLDGLEGDARSDRLALLEQLASEGVTLKELHDAAITEVAQANRFLQRRFLPAYNRELAVPAAETTAAPARSRAPNSPSTAGGAKEGEGTRFSTPSAPTGTSMPRSQSHSATARTWACG